MIYFLLNRIQNRAKERIKETPLAMALVLKQEQD
jgi:hypothetical protein